MRAEVGKAIIGQDPVLTGLVICLLCRGHVLLEGVPGVAKTLLVRSLAAALSLRSTRVQFTPDLMPGDVTGSLVYDAKTALFQFREGPVFTNLLLADEINRTPPKTQAALLEAMEERQVSVEGQPRPLPEPFLVAATQNPVEYEGTYPLPEAQLDRFLVKLTVELPGRDDEIGILARHAAGFDPGNLAATGIKPVAGPAELAAASAAVREVRVAAGGGGLHRGPVPRHPAVAVAAPGRVPARGHRAAGHQPGLGLAGRPRLCDAGRREGAGPADVAAPDPAPPGSGDRGRVGGRGARGGPRLRPRAPVSCSPGNPAAAVIPVPGNPGTAVTPCSRRNPRTAETPRWR